MTGYSHASLQEDNISAGIELFKSGQYEQAYEILLKAFEESPENLELNFYLGRAAFETNNFEMAVMVFERILIASPDELRVKLEMARAFQRLGANDIARQYCNEVLMSDPPESVKVNIKKFLIQIDKSEQKHFLSGMISMGIDWNNNVWASPSTGKVKTLIGDITLSGPSAKKIQDWAYNTILAMSHTYQMPYSKDSWKTQAIFYNSVYDETSELDLYLTGITTGYETAISNNKRIGLSILANYVNLGKDSYLGTKGFKVYLNHILNPGLSINTQLKHEIKNFTNIPLKNANNNALFMNMTLLNNNVWYNVGVKAEKENARSDDYDYLRGASNISIGRELFFGLNGSIHYRYQYTEYKNKDFLFGIKRQDHQHIAGCTLKKKLWQDATPSQYIALNLNYQHTWAFSNIELYDYTSDLLQLFLTYNF